MAFCLPVNFALAMDANYTPFIVGGRAAGMGGAVSASATDSDAAYHNPAGLGAVKHNSISVSAALYGYQGINIDDRVAPGVDLDATTFVTIPSQLSMVYKLAPDVAGAFSVFVPSQLSVSQSNSPSPQSAYSFSINDQTLYLGPSAGWKVNDRLTLGASLFAIYAEHAIFENVVFRKSGSIGSENVDVWNWGVQGVLGAQYQLAEMWRAGLTLESPSWILTGSDALNGGDLQSSWHDLNHQVWDFYSNDVEVNMKTPLSARGGLEWGLAKQYGIEFDVTWHASDNYTELHGTTDAGLDYSNYRKRRNVVDYALGGEYYVDKVWPLRLGGFTSISAQQEVTLQDDNQPDQVDLYGFTVSAGREEGPVEINLGINYIWGDGHALGQPYMDSESTIVKASESYLYFFVSTAYIF